MGQPITVTARPGVRGDVMNFELNRSLTGMETHRYTAAVPPTGPKPPDELARRLFEIPGVSAVTVYSSVVTVVAPQDQWAGLRSRVEDMITNLFIYYRDGQSPAVAAPAEGSPGEGTAESAPAEGAAVSG